MKVFITGGAGFIGSTLADRLAVEGHQVLVVDNYETGRRDNLVEKPGVKIVEGTIVDEHLMEQLFSDFKPEIVIHAAASYKDPDNWIEDTSTNTMGGAIVIQKCQKYKVQRLIYFQTALCYGNAPTEQPVTLDSPMNPESSYAISKTTTEQYLAISGLDFVSFRLANMYGPRNVSGPLPTFYHRLGENKPCFVMETRRDFVYITDLIDVVMKAIAGQGKGIYHVSSGLDYAIKDLFDATLKAMNIQLKEPVEVRPRNPDDAFTILLDPSKTEKDFDWKTKVELEDGIEKTIRYYDKFGITETYTHLRGVKEGK
jgi:UDP-glucose 4-epimerase